LSQPGAGRDRAFFWFQILTCATNNWYKEMRTGQVCHHSSGPNANHGEIMASAVREAIRTPARMESENVRDQHLEAGGHIVSPAFRRLHRAKIGQDPADWLAGFEAGLHGDSYGYPAEVPDRLAWASGFVEGRAQQARPERGSQQSGNIDCRQRLQRLAGIRITPWFARPLWELLGLRP
jgi:hypothetical protein